MQHLLDFRSNSRSWRGYVALSEEQKKLYKNNQTHIKIQVQYNEGGMNYFTGSLNKRCYRLSFTPIARLDRGESCILMSDTHESGAYVLLEEAKRYNAKRLKEVAEMIDPEVPSIALAIIENDINKLRELVKLEQTVSV